GKGRGMELHRIPETEGAFEANAPKSDGVQRSLVRIPEAAERREMLFDEVPAIVAEDEVPVLNANRCFRSARVVGILQQFRQHMPRALHLLEKQMPRTGQLGVALQLLPPAGRGFTDRLEIQGLCHHRGGSARAISSGKS